MFPTISLTRRGPGRSQSAHDRRKARTTFRPMAPSPMEARTLLSVGGGYTAGGLVGQYYSNASLSGTPAFTRDDVRVNFDWGTTQAPGGSIDAGFNAVGAQNFSAQWTGQVIPTFGETYTFKANSAGGGDRLSIRPTGTTTWTTLVDDWTPHASKIDTGTFAMTAGTSYDIRLQYAHTTGAAAMGLSWSSPSTPEEVIDPVAQVGINNPDWTAAFTNLVQGARNNWSGASRGPAPAMDAAGWPTADGSYVFQESLNQGLGVDPLMLGTVTFRFQGSANVAVTGNVDAKSLAYHYDPTTNSTTGAFNTLDRGINASSFVFTNSHRDGQPNGPGGITNLQLMRPVAPGASTSYGAGTVFTPQIVQAMGHYTLIRFQEIADQEMNWTDRTLPTFFNQDGGSTTAPHLGNGPTSNDGTSWEYKVMLANETGRDMMISIPPLASGESPSDVNSYISNLANLLKYGSDGVNPYTSPQANPVYPPLNSNLRVYFEIGNELWNWSNPYFTDYSNVNSMVAAHAAANDADFQALNFDGLSTAQDSSGNYASMNTWRTREVMLRVVQMSDIFRSVFGDSAMMNRIRPLYEWQYNNANNTAQNALSFADDYFDNADGLAHVATPHPVSYYVWGGGGATYYSAANPDGLTTLVADSGFDATPVAVGYNQAPAGTSWTFGGTAGIARDGGPLGRHPGVHDRHPVGIHRRQGVDLLRRHLPDEPGLQRLRPVVQGRQPRPQRSRGRREPPRLPRRRRHHGEDLQPGQRRDRAGI